VYKGTFGDRERFTTADGIVVEAERTGGAITRLRVDGGSYYLLLAKR
jgi:hypothetical protein